MLDDCALPRRSSGPPSTSHGAPPRPSTACPQSSPPQAITQSPVFTALHFRFMEPQANSSAADAVSAPVEVSDDDEEEEMAKIRSSELDRVVLPSGLEDHEYDALMESYEAEASGQAEMAKAFNLQSKLTH